MAKQRMVKISKGAKEFLDMLVSDKKKNNPFWRPSQREILDEAVYEKYAKLAKVPIELLKNEKKKY